MKDFKIKKITINDNSVIEPTRINIIVGPNSSGKSRLLKDIRQSLSNNNYPYNNKLIVIKDIEYELPDDYDEFIDKYNIEDRIVNYGTSVFIRNYHGANLTVLDNDSSLNNYMINNNINMSNNWREELENDFFKFNDKSKNINNFLMYGIPKNATNVEVINQELVRYKENGQTIERILGGSSGPGYNDVKEGRRNFISKYGTLFFQYLGTEEKLLMCKKQKRFGIDSSNLNILSESQLHIEDIKELSKITKELFGKYIYLDRSSFGDSLAFRVSDDFDFYNKIETNNSNSEREILKYPLLDDEGDGIKNFVSTYLSIKSMNKKLILVDEPESFLHPPLARRFGEILSKTIKKDQQLFVATHSEDIINGIVSTTDENNFSVIRIERNKNINKIYQMPCEYRLIIRNKPLILMSNILKGLFSERVYITESYSDSSLYQNLMIKYNDYSSFYFVNTEGKDKIYEVIRIYDLMGVKNIAIFDFDYFRKEYTIKQTLKDKIYENSEYQRIYGIFTKARDYIIELSNRIAIEKNDNYDQLKDKMKEEKKSKIRDDIYHREGINSIKDKDLREQLNNELDNIKKLGIYVIKTGALETVLQENGFRYSNNKNFWIDEAMEFVDKLSKDELKKSNIIDLISGKV